MLLESFSFLPATLRLRTVPWVLEWALLNTDPLLCTFAGIDLGPDTHVDKARP